MVAKIEIRVGLFFAGRFYEALSLLSKTWAYRFFAEQWLCRNFLHQIRQRTWPLAPLKRHRVFVFFYLSFNWGKPGFRLNFGLFWFLHIYRINRVILTWTGKNVIPELIEEIQSFSVDPGWGNPTAGIKFQSE